jgi:hypothetical protein
MKQKITKTRIFFLAVIICGNFFAAGQAAAVTCLCSSNEPVIEGTVTPPPAEVDCDEACKTGPCAGLSCAPKSIYSSKPAAPAKPQMDIGAYTPKMQIEIGGKKILFDPVKCSAGEICEIPWLGQYIDVLYRYIIGFAAVLAAVMMMAGGFLWLTSAGNPTRVSQGKEFIGSAMLGLLLALFSYTILFTINPNLVILKPLTTTSVVPLDGPAWTFSGGGGGAGAPCTGDTVVGGVDFQKYATSCDHANGVRSYYQQAGKITTAEEAQAFIHRFPGSKLTGQMVIDAAAKYNIDPAVLLAEMAQDSSMMTAGRGADSNNPGNIANADNEADTTSGCNASGGTLTRSERGTLNCSFPTPEAGVNACANWLSRHPAKK